MKIPTPRSEVYAAIDSERDYQENLRLQAGGTNNGSDQHEVAAFLLYMKVYLDKAIYTSSTDWSPLCDARTLDSVRKVAALAVACMEGHGAPVRAEAAKLDKAHGF